MSICLVDSYNHSNTIIMHQKSHFDKNYFLVTLETYKKNHFRGFRQITLNKPCSVLDNHLSAPRCLANRFISLLQVPLPKFGFLAYGVYHVPLLYFYKTRLFDTFTGSIHGLLFRIFASRQPKLPKLIVSLGINTTSVAGCASMDFPLKFSDCLNVICYKRSLRALIPSLTDRRNCRKSSRTDRRPSSCFQARYSSKSVP